MRRAHHGHARQLRVGREEPRLHQHPRHEALDGGGREDRGIRGCDVAGVARRRYQRRIAGKAGRVQLARGVLAVGLGHAGADVTHQKLEFGQGVRALHDALAHGVVVELRVRDGGLAICCGARRGAVLCRRGFCLRGDASMRGGGFVRLSTRDLRRGCGKLGRACAGLPLRERLVRRRGCGIGRRVLLARRRASTLANALDFRPRGSRRFGLVAACLPALCRGPGKRQNRACAKRRGACGERPADAVQRDGLVAAERRHQGERARARNEYVPRRESVVCHAVNHLSAMGAGAQRRPRSCLSFLLPNRTAVFQCVTSL